MRFLRERGWGSGPRRAGWLGSLGLFALALALQATLTWFEAGHTAAGHGASCSLPAGADCRPDSRNPTGDASHDSRSCFQCQFFRNAAGAEPVTVADTDASATLLPERVATPVFRALGSPRHERPEPRAPPRLQALTLTVSA
ncbi:hypothetical protein FJ251_14910 [bacterium]|nr:hypothetical protein [bacterium]